MKIQLPATLHEMHNSRGWQMFEESKLGNDLFINDPDRAGRIYEATTDGCDGSTHSEHIDDQREYVDELYHDALRETDDCETMEAADTLEQQIEAWHDRFIAELDAIEDWHQKNGSLHQQVG